MSIIKLNFDFMDLTHYLDFPKITFFNEIDDELYIISLNIRYELINI